LALRRLVEVDLSNFSSLDVVEKAMETVTEARAVVPANETARRVPVSLGRRTEASGESPAEDSLRLSTMQRAFRASGGVFDDWELTQWFASPNAWLRGESPSDALIGDASSVLETARADRFVATG
jgi:hypothetical protein